MTIVNNPDKFVEGYANQVSVAAGEGLGLCVSTNAQRYSVKITRVGCDRQIVWTKDEIPGKKYPVPDDASTHGCKWPEALEVPVGKDWPSGYYHVLLSVDGGASGELSFVVRSERPGRDSSILLQLATNTRNAYNTWGGSSLYRGPDTPGRRVSFDRPDSGFVSVDGLLLFSMGLEFEDDLDSGVVSERFRDAFQEQVEAFGVPGILLSLQGTIATQEPGRLWWIDDVFGMGPPGYKVKKSRDSIDVYDGTPIFENGWENWESLFVTWAERKGYKLDFAANSDLEFHPEMLEDYRLVLSVGHDEYWSSPMRDHLEAFIASGGNVGFFSGNSGWWQVRSEDKGRALVCWKEAYKQDPFYANGDHALLSTLWCNHLIGRPENHLTGVSFAFGGYRRFFDQFLDSSGGYTIHRPDHWIFEGTGLRRGDVLGERHNVASYECDGCRFHLEQGLPVPTLGDGTPETFQILATARAGFSMSSGAQLGEGNESDQFREALYGNESDVQHPQPGAACLGSYTRGGTVFTTGCTNWAHGLKGGDEAVERITHNVLSRLSK